MDPENEAEGTKAESSGLANQRKQVKNVKCSRSGLVSQHFTVTSRKQ